MDSSILSSILFATIVAGTPLIIVALGQLIAEKSGVLNLGAEGMMAMGAIAGFAVTLHSGNPWLGVLAGMLAGAAMSFIFAVVVLTLMGNQVASGLALSILGVGLSAFIGKPYESDILPTVGALRIPLLADLPIIGGPLFNQQAMVYFSWALFGGLAWFLYRRRHRTGITCGRGITIFGAFDRLPGNSHSLHGDHFRRRDGRYWRCLPVGVLHPAVGGRHGFRARLDSDCAGGFCDLATVSSTGGRLPVRWRHGGAIVRPGFGTRYQYTLTVSVSPALPGDDYRAGDYFARPEHGAPQCAGFVGAAIQAVGLMENKQVLINWSLRAKRNNLTRRSQSPGDCFVADAPLGPVGLAKTGFHKQITLSMG